MFERYSNIVLILLALSFFLGATVQYAEGSNILGIFLFIIGMGLLSRIKIDRAKEFRSELIKPRVYGMVGALIILSDAAYNYSGSGRAGINTLDTMTLLLGASLIGLSLKSAEIRRLGVFGAVMSSSFIVLYLTFYVILNEQLYRFDHYFVLLPSAYLVKALGLPIEIVGTETLRLGGVDDLIVKIGGPCSGLYSMFLLIGIVLGYSATEGIKDLKRIAGLATIAAVVAYGGNLIRVSVLYIVGYFYGSETMMTVHVHLGWMIFAVTSLSLLYLMERTRLMLAGRAA